MAEGDRPLRIQHEVEDDAVAAGRQRRRAFPAHPLQVQQVEREDRLAVLQVQAPAAEAPALREQHAIGAAGGNLDLGGDAVGPVEQVRRRIGLGAAGRPGIDELPATSGGAGARVDHACQRCHVERENLVARGFHGEDVAHHAQPVGELAGDAGHLRRVVGQVVEFPLQPVRDVGRARRHRAPGRCGRCRVGEPAIMVDALVAENFEVLGPPRGRRIGRGRGEGIGHRGAGHRALRDAVDRLRRLQARRFQDGRHDVDHVVELGSRAAALGDAARPGHRHPVAGAAEVGGHLLGPAIRRAEGPGPAHRHVVVGLVGAPGIVPGHLLFGREADAVEVHHLVRRAVERAFGAAAIVAADVDDQRVVALAEALDLGDDAADLGVGIGQVGRVDIGLADEQPLRSVGQAVPARHVVGPGRELRIRRDHAHALLVGEDAFAQAFIAVVEQVHRLDPLHPFAGRVVRGVGAAGRVVDEPRAVRRDLGLGADIGDGVVRHRGDQVEARVAVVGMDRRGVAEQVARLPLAGIAADEAEEVVEAHADRPVGEGPGGRGLPGRHVVVLAEPGGGVAIRLQDGADRRRLARDDRIVAGEAGGEFADIAEADLVVVVPGQQRGARGRAQRGRVEGGVAQPRRRHTIERRGGDHAAEGGGGCEADIIGQDQQHVGRVLRRHGLRRPGRLAVDRVGQDLAGEGWRGRRQLQPLRRHHSARRAGRATELLRGHARGRGEYDDRRRKQRETHLRYRGHALSPQRPPARFRPARTLTLCTITATSKRSQHYPKWANSLWRLKHDRHTKRSATVIRRIARDNPWQSSPGARSRASARPTSPGARRHGPRAAPGAPAPGGAA
ncbi:hypothetical protein ROS9278_04518 [Roseomonas sp. CECT 9278]|nr:hypothetical protein ROS9278_04518 [Roseomonas sp. CECT 9278]